jgi:hypothetical protein
MRWALAALLFLLLAPCQALAARDLEVAIMDDQLLLTHDRARIDSAMRTFRELGVDRLRVSAFWRDIAPAPEAHERPAGFAAHDHAAPGYRWEVLDGVVSTARAHGLDVLLTVTTPAPLWASEAPARGNPVWKPKPLEFGRFAEAVATRYASQVDMYAILNEPNQGAWLQPQSDGNGLAAPHRYRRFVNSAYPRIKRADPGSTVLIGELASSGRRDRGATRPIRPLLFLREMACRDRRFRARRRGRCRAFSAPRTDAIGHHPYKFAGRPDRRSRERDDAAIGDWRRLLRTLDELTRRRAIRSMRTRRLNVHYTEFGYETDPPDPVRGISLRRQDEYLQQAFHYAWLTPRVRGLTQFRLTDGTLLAAAGRARFGEYQSGLMFADGRPKRAFHSFTDPFWISDRTPRRGRRIRLWGQVRPGSRRIVVLEYRTRSGRRWRRLERFRTNRAGYWTRVRRARSGQYRFRWGRGASTVRTVRVHR